jgi:hypothetical protein
VQPVRRGWLGAGLVVGIFLLGVLAAGYAVATQGTGGSAPGRVAATLTSGPTILGLSVGPPPWLPETADLRTRLDEIGVPALTAEGEALHTHQHLDLFVDGQSVPVPADIGINVAAGFLAPIHTHDTTGIIHVESPTVRDFTLGGFFDIWGVRFGAHCIGGECDGNGRSLEVFVNGKRVSGDPRAVKLEPHQEIVVALGTAIPNSVPSSYPFPPGL